MAFTGPYPTTFSGHTDSMLISAATFTGGVTNAGTISPGGVTITSSTFLSGGFVNTNLISGATNAIAVLAHSTINGTIVDSGRIVATNFGANGVFVSGGAEVLGGIQVGSHGVISAHSGIRVVGGIVNSGIISAGKTGANISGVTTVSGGIVNRGTITTAQVTGNMGIFVT
jgi:hypothetical protein